METIEKEKSKVAVNKTARKVIVKTMTVEKDANEVFDFFNDMKSMEIGGAIKSLRKGQDDWWRFEHTIAAKSKMKHISVPQYGILDHVFI